jgi:alcohol dehydrogenase class IV
MEPFVYTARPAHVIFGSGSTSKLLEELTRQEFRAAFILCTPRGAKQAAAIEQLLAPNTVGIFSKATMHTPTDITQEALRVAQDLKADSIVSIGGGSTIGLGKAISLRSGLPHICLPTTYAGSEMTEILGETVDGAKTTRRDPKILPGTVIYDVDLTMSLPPRTSATSGLNAIAHAVEALYAPDTNPIIRCFAKEGIRALSEALVVIVDSSDGRDARSKALYGAWLCGICLGSTSMSLHHKLCHALGGSLNLPHAETHAILLPHTFAYNSPAVVIAAQDLADALPDSGGDAVGALNTLLDRLGVEKALKSFGMKEEDINKAVAAVMKDPYSNPRGVEEEHVREIVRRAWAGEDARADV